LVMEHFEPEYVNVVLDKKPKETKKMNKSIKLETYQQ
jgi:hypothetical protein